MASQSDWRRAPVEAMPIMTGMEPEEIRTWAAGRIAAGHEDVVLHDNDEISILFADGRIPGA